ncbi:MAG: branched-chain amino acid ABC transporter permease [Desulfarculus sp.]|nr:branched-chain amino acid ABC transporter permease [Pseudomonadota bacterium]MBV1717897.1 branched-chain amino acid ABC transporter permease [Desulfarculus sp.]MBU4574453.1 branched-chain amino acid ABC transporter permease [Pseudomonadota bacterium]MBU4597442.1 branched-chain amino acid ABC transporter permease [Pseudomonadota bacterium]MBV1737772.1 branched-chain amino acid ABC transporter permease [Desulfarculus sp.]
MDSASHITLAALGQQLLVGLSRTTILFIVSSGLSLILGVLRIPNVSHGSLYMIGAFVTYSVATFIGGQTGFWVALAVAPVAVGLLALAVERGIFCHLYEREHLMLLLFTFSLMLVLGDVVKLIWGSDYRSLAAPPMMQGSFSLGGMPFPRYNLFLLILGPLVAVGLWALTNKTKIGKIARAAAVDREMVAAMGINVSWVFAFVFCLGCLMAGLGGALVAPTQNITQGMDHAIIMEAFLIVIIGGLGNMWGALLGAAIFGITDSIGILVWPQFAIVFPYVAVTIVLVFRPKGLLKSTW